MHSFELFYIPSLDDSLFVHAGIILNSGLLFRLKSAQQKYKKLDFPDRLQTEEQRSDERDSSLQIEVQGLTQNHHSKEEGSQELEKHMSDDVQPELRSPRKPSQVPPESTFYTVSESMLHAYLRTMTTASRTCISSDWFGSSLCTMTIAF